MSPSRAVPAGTSGGVAAPQPLVASAASRATRDSSLAAASATWSCAM
jgi:hypothetical protein